MAVVETRDSSQTVLGTNRFPHTDSIEPAELVRSLRQCAGFSQRVLAGLLGTTQPAVSRWEQGHDEPRLSTLNAVAHACGRRLTISVVDEEQVVDGVDRAQILAHLAMSPDERIQAVTNMSRFRASIESA